MLNMVDIKYLVAELLKYSFHFRNDDSNFLTFNHKNNIIYVHFLVHVIYQSYNFVLFSYTPSFAILDVSLYIFKHM